MSTRELDLELAPPATAKPAPKGYRWVYVWHWPIRAMHWTAAACILTLVVTGLYIGKPYFMTSGQASAHFLMGWVRLVHFTAAGVLVATAIVRIYWLFAGNRFERWSALFPIKPRDYRNLFRTLKAYLLIGPDDPPRYIGHNTAQQLSYTFIYVLAAVEVITGFTLFGQYNPGGFFSTVFAWVPPLLGGLQIVRFVHHVVTWLFLIFIVGHVYLAIRSDVTELQGGISSIIDGGKFVRDDVKYEDD